MSAKVRMHAHPSHNHRCDRCLLCTTKRGLKDHLKSGKCEPYYSDVPHELLLEQLESGARDNPWQVPHATRADLEPELRGIIERVEHCREKRANEEPKHGACITQPRDLPPAEVVDECGRGPAPLADLAIAMYSDALRYFEELKALEVWLAAARAWVVVADVWALLDFVLDALHDALCSALEEREGVSEAAARKIAAQRQRFGLTDDGNPANGARKQLREVLLDRLAAHTARVYADQGGYPVERYVSFATTDALARAAVAFNVLPNGGPVVLVGLTAAIEALCFATGDVMYRASLSTHHYVCKLERCNFQGGALPLTRSLVVEKVLNVVAREVCGAIDAGHVSPVACNAFYTRVGAALGLKDVHGEDREAPRYAGRARKLRLAREHAAGLMKKIVHLLAKKHALVLRQCVNDRGVREIYVGAPSA